MSFEPLSTFTDPIGLHGLSLLNNYRILVHTVYFSSVSIALPNRAFLSVYLWKKIPVFNKVCCLVNMNSTQMAQVQKIKMENSGSCISDPTN